MCDVYRAALSPISHKSTELIEHEHGAQKTGTGTGTNLISDVLKYVPEICIHIPQLSSSLATATAKWHFLLVVILEINMPFACHFAALVVCVCVSGHTNCNRLLLIKAH